MTEDRTGTGASEDRTGVSGARLAVGVAIVVVAVVAGVAVPDGDAWTAALSLVGLAGVVAAVRSVLRRYREGVDAAVTGDPETGVVTPTPGAGFTRALGTFEDEGATYLAYPDRVRSALENAAVAVLGRYRGIPPETARERLRAGTWTDDEQAVAFLRGEGADGRGDRPEGLGARVRRLARLRGRIAGESSFQRGIRHTVAAVAAVSGADVGGPDAMTVEGREASGTTRPGGGGSAPPTPAATDGGTTPAGVVRPTGRWTGIAGGALACAGLGLLGNWPAVVLAATVGVGVAAYARAVDPPVADLAVERSVSETTPTPGERVGVTLTVRNAADRTVPDLRVVEGVPPALSVASGSVRTGTALRPGEAVTLTYELRAGRGVHEFDPVTLVTRDAAGTLERERRVRADPVGSADREGEAGEDASGIPDESANGDPGDGVGANGNRSVDADGTDDRTTVVCVPPLTAGARSVPIEGAAASYAGEVATTTAGDGIEFHSVRAYEPSDPIGRIDWKRYARTRELAAREFRSERATTAVVVVDARRAAYLSPAPGRPHAVDRAVAAARRAFAALEGDGNRVGIAALGRTECWLAPGTGADHRARARDLLATHPALSSVPPDDGGGREDDETARTDWLRARLPADAQVVFVSPVCDDAAAGIVRRLRAHGYPVTAVSPDPTASETPSQALARVGRRLRLARLRDAGARVIDRRADEPLAGALGRANRP